jgi:alkylhydroperoxidase family enzyme
MARITYPCRDQLPADLEQMLSEMPRHAPVDMLAHSPQVAAQALRVAQAQFTSLELSTRNRELVILAVAAGGRCEYEYTQHVPASEAAGVAPALREAIWRGDVDTTSLADEDRVLLAFVGAVLDSPQIGETEVVAARRHFSDREIVEILQLVGFYWGLGRLCTVLDLEIDAPDGLTSLEALSNLSDRG